MPIPIKSPEEIERLRTAGRLLWSILADVISMCRAGVRSNELDAAARAAIRSAGADPILDGYTQHGAPPFTGAACICINEEAVHAPPSPRILRPGDLVTIDMALRLGGWCADAARSVLVPGSLGDAPPDATPGDAARLHAATERAIDAAILAMAPGSSWSSVASAMASVAAGGGCAIVAGYSGHGIGRALHEPPRAWGAQPRGCAPEADFTLRPGMVLTVEPILTLGRPETILLDDGWTVLVADRSPACHEERTVAITRAGPELLTAP